MSYAVHPYAVLGRDMEKALGSRDRRLLETLRKRYAAELDEVDEIDDEAIPAVEALEGLIMGGKLDGGAGFKYGYALKILCEHLGEMLPNRHWSGMRWEWFEEVDGAVARLGIPEERFRVENHLAGRGAPVELPPIDDFPSIGYLRESEIVAVATALEKADGLKAEDAEVKGAIGEIRGWLDRCARSHRDLICFYH